MIEVKNLVKRYGDHLAVNRLSFTVEEGQIYGFLGPNGAGKSTTMNIITGYLAATEGEVVINGHPYIVEDTGGAIKGHRIDIYFESHEAALEFGVQEVDIYRAKS